MILVQKIVLIKFLMKYLFSQRLGLRSVSGWLWFGKCYAYYLLFVLFETTMRE